MSCIGLQMNWFFGLFPINSMIRNDSLQHAVNFGYVAVYTQWWSKMKPCYVWNCVSIFNNSNTPLKEWSKNCHLIMYTCCVDKLMSASLVCCYLVVCFAQKLDCCDVILQTLIQPFPWWTLRPIQNWWSAKQILPALTLALMLNWWRPRKPAWKSPTRRFRISNWWLGWNVQVVFHREADQLAHWMGIALASGTAWCKPAGTVTSKSPFFSPSLLMIQNSAGVQLYNF